MQMYVHNDMGICMYMFGYNKYTTIVYLVVIPCRILSYMWFECIRLLFHFFYGLFREFFRPSPSFVFDQFFEVGGTTESFGYL